MKKLVLILASFLFGATAHAAAPAEIEIIFDASRSMNEANEGTTRLAVAKQALTTIAGKMTAENRVGLRVFGQTPVRGNIKESCVDSKLVIPIGPADGAAMIVKIMDVKAHGQTPIGHSLELAAKDFSQGSDVKKTIILISDGEESCGKDPATVASALKAQGIDIVIHTIGFDVNEVARGQLKKLAELTGGTYADAQNAEELTLQLEEVAQKSMLLTIQRGTEKNILAASEGTRIVSSSVQHFAQLIDGKEEAVGTFWASNEAVFSFKDNQLVKLKKFEVPIFEVGRYNPAGMQLFGSVESSEKGFFPILDFAVQNKVYFGNVYQGFAIEPPVIVRYLKVVLGAGSSGSYANHTEWRAIGDYVTGEEAAGFMQTYASRDLNVLGAENGGQLIASSKIEFKNLIDSVGDNAGSHVDVAPGQEGIFGFKDGKTVSLKKIAVPIFEQGTLNCKVLEFYASTTAPTSGYTKIGAFETMNLVFAGNPYQEYAFETPVEAKYLKVVLKETHGHTYCRFHELKAIGSYKE